MSIASSVRYLSASCLVASVVSSAGCAPDEATGTAVQHFFGRTSYSNAAGSYVSPFTAAYVERSMFHARTVARAPAFATCVANDMNANYVFQPGDPLPTSTRLAQITEAWNRLLTYDNALNFRQIPTTQCPGGSACAHVGAPDNATHEINVMMHDENFPDWSWYGVAPRSPWEPWHWRTAEMIHEYMHTQGYNHVTADSGTTSVPYIYTNCAYHMIEESSEACGNIHQGCPPGQLRLLHAWSGTSATEQSDTAACACVADPRHVVALRTSTNQYVTATSGGGTTLSTSWTNVAGAWQWFYAFDVNGGAWLGSDSVYLKSFNGPFVRRTASGWSADGAEPFDVQLTPVSGTAVANNSVVRVRSGANYAYDNGTTLLSSTSSSGTNRNFTLLEPRRDHLVYLRTYHGTYVNRDAEMNLYNTRTSAELNGTTETSRALKAAAAFWVIDWNGGELQDGDSVSLESFQDGAYHYLSVRDGDHTGPARLVNGVHDYERFQINILSGATGNVVYSNDGNPANDTNLVSFRSANGTYLTAMPTGTFSSQIRNYGTYEGEWQRFAVVFVQEYDRHRASW